MGYEYTGTSLIFICEGSGCRKEIDRSKRVGLKYCNECREKINKRNDRRYRQKKRRASFLNNV